MDIVQSKLQVCEKVQAKGSTSYNEVADELVAELTDPRCTSPTDQQYDQKNIRRRVGAMIFHSSLEIAAIVPNLRSTKPCCRLRSTDPASEAG